MHTCVDTHTKLMLLGRSTLWKTANVKEKQFIIILSNPPKPLIKFNRRARTPCPPPPREGGQLSSLPLPPVQHLNKQDNPANTQDKPARQLSQFLCQSVPKLDLVTLHLGHLTPASRTRMKERHTRTTSHVCANRGRTRVLGSLLY